MNELLKEIDLLWAIGSCNLAFGDADSFWGLEAAYGRVDGVVKTAAGYCGGTIRKPPYREVSN